MTARQSGEVETRPRVEAAWPSPETMPLAGDGRFQTSCNGAGLFYARALPCVGAVANTGKREMARENPGGPVEDGAEMGLSCLCCGGRLGCCVTRRHCVSSLPLPPCEDEEALKQPSAPGTAVHLWHPPRARGWPLVLSLCDSRAPTGQDRNGGPSADPQTRRCSSSRASPGPLGNSAVILPVRSHGKNILDGVGLGYV